MFNAGCVFALLSLVLASATAPALAPAPTFAPATAFALAPAPPWPRLCFKVCFRWNVQQECSLLGMFKK